jgi:hypothetical protein
MSDIEKKIDRLLREVQSLKKVPEKSTWVTHVWIMEVTGWNKRKLQAAREQKIIEYKESPGGGYLYKLESIPEQFIKKVS